MGAASRKCAQGDPQFGSNIADDAIDESPVNACPLGDVYRLHPKNLNVHEPGVFLKRVGRSSARWLRSNGRPLSFDEALNCGHAPFEQFAFVVEDGSDAFLNAGHSWVRAT